MKQGNLVVAVNLTCATVRRELSLGLAICYLSNNLRNIFTCMDKQSFHHQSLLDGLLCNSITSHKGHCTSSAAVLFL